MGHLLSVESSLHLIAAVDLGGSFGQTPLTLVQEATEPLEQRAGSLLQPGFTFWTLLHTSTKNEL